MIPQIPRQSATAKSGEEPCLWLRGLLPSHHTEIAPQYHPNPEVKPIITNAESIDQKSQNMMTIVFYGDASGGLFSSIPRIRRIGCGLIQIDNEGNRIWTHHFNLPGPFQTVPRGELYVLLYLVHRLEPGSKVTYVTDNQKVRDIFVQGKAVALKSTNCDLSKKFSNYFTSMTSKCQADGCPLILDQTTRDQMGCLNWT